MIPRLAFVLLLVLNGLLWSRSRFGQLSPALSASVARHHRPLHARSLLSLAGSYYVEEEKECRPLVFPIEEQCLHVSDICPASDTFLSIPYLHTYFCSEPAVRPVVFTAYILWLFFLFTMLGISASDFFCPNLATIAQLLGLDENVAGVTFLAFGNGSPDVFSTFSAMRADAGSLAIGELLGAASFIVSVVVGSMCIIKPFRINRGPFLRDIGFFAAAVAILLAILSDGYIHTWEALSLVVLYVIYVVTVVVGTWWERRQYHKSWLESRIRSEHADDDSPTLATYFEDQPYRDEPRRSPSPHLLPLPTPHGRPASAALPRLGLQTDLPPRSRSRSESESLSAISHLPSFSLVGALEFRDVVASLQSQAAGASLNAFESPRSPYPGGLYRRFHTTPYPRNSVRLEDEVDPWDASLGVRLEDCSPRAAGTQPLPRVVEPLVDVSGQPSTQPDNAPIPSIIHTPASPVATPDAEAQPEPAPSRRQRVLSVLARAYRILFPTLHDFRQKSVVGKAAAVVAAPAVLCLTLTLPVIVMPYDSARAHPEKSVLTAEPLIAFEEEEVGIEQVVGAEEEVQGELRDLVFNKWLMATQCTLGPLFCVGVLFKNMDKLIWLQLAALIAGLAVGVLVLLFAVDGEHPAARMARCSMGFVVAIVWIMAIADEVVNVLQTFGFIFGLSDAIIGLTIFAVGNSLADLVANTSIAVFAPIMGFSACFGGPMLNMLLGVGMSGSYVTSQSGVPYRLHISKTLFVSGGGLLFLLLATAIFVPLNGYYLPRKWGVFLICCYTALMAVNIVIEVLSHHAQLT